MSSERRIIQKASAMVLALISLVLLNCSGPSVENDLVSGFQDPPASAKPRVWWHWMNGNISKGESGLIWNGCTGLGLEDSRILMLGLHLLRLSKKDLFT
jgi:hypothetical protein